MAQDIGVKCLNEAHGDDWSVYHGDTTPIIHQLPDNSVDFSIFSPPFSGLYIYNDSECDMGNCKDDAEFFEHYAFLAQELYRVIRPGRLVAVHCKDLVFYKNQRGSAGLRDFPGGLIRAHEDVGFNFHSRITIWRDPVREMTKTKAHGLLYKQLRADSSFSRVGLPEYFVVFRKWASPDEETAFSIYWKSFMDYQTAIEMSDDPEDTALRLIGPPPLIMPVKKTRDDFPLPWWQETASPVWMNTRETDVLNARRVPTDEKHICPIPLDIVTRATALWSNPGDVVLSPFMGIGSEGHVALKMRRKFVGIELKQEYWQQACRHLRNASSNAVSLFDAAD